MSTTIAVVAAGAMGAAVGARLAEGGARVLTSTAGRSEASAARARVAGMAAAPDRELMAADIFLSIVPPDQAAGLAARMAKAADGNRQPIYVDLNAIAPATAREVAAIIAPSGATFVDGGIIGGPPQPGLPGPAFCLSGPAEACGATLARHGLAVRVIEGGIGAASALKMAYAGITKGIIAVGACMILAAQREGVDRALDEQLGASLPPIRARLEKAMPDMLPKACRWVPEMREIAAFIGADLPESAIYRGMSDLYRRIAADLEHEGDLARALTGFFAAA